MFPVRFSGPVGDALGKTRSGRDFGAYGGPSQAFSSEGLGEKGIVEIKKALGNLGVTLKQ